MKYKRLLLFVDVVVLGLLGGGITLLVSSHRSEPPADEFATMVDLSALERMPVLIDGRIKAFDSHARNYMNYVCGRRQVNGQSPSFTYLDLMLRPEAYDDAEIIYVKNKNVRQRFIEALGEKADEAWARRFLDRGMISRHKLHDPRIVAVIGDLEKDVIRTSRDVDRLHSALAVSDASLLSSHLRILPPPNGDVHASWFSVSDLTGPDVPQIEAHAGFTGGAAIPGLAESQRSALVETWQGFVAAWKEQNAAAVASALESFAAQVHGLAPAFYPSTDQMELENWYFRNHGMTWVWLVYLVAVVPLLISAVYRWQGARTLGLLLFVVAFGFHTASLLIRWKVADRWPNSNMFEAIHTAAWFGVVAALVLEWVARRTPMRNLFALGASVCGMAALMAGRYTDQITPEISNFMPILNDIWLYIHTNMIIASYALIGAAAVIALIYLRYRLGGGSREVAKAGGAGTLILANAPGGQFLKDEPAKLGQVLDGATMIVMELSFVMLWAGLVMGAIWADHSWGRPWGWDPKEVFALNTFIVFMLLVHVRYKVRDKGFWTAILAVAGCGVMLFNWIVINFAISGLHSYA